MFDRFIERILPNEEQTQSLADAYLWAQDCLGSVLVVAIPVGLGLVTYLLV
jgi:hypothetical protein